MTSQTKLFLNNDSVSVVVQEFNNFKTIELTLSDHTITIFVDPPQWQLMADKLTHLADLMITSNQKTGATPVEIVDKEDAKIASDLADDDDVPF